MERDKYILCYCPDMKITIQTHIEPHPRHCIVSLSNTHYSLLNTGSTQDDPSDITEKMLTGT